ncbi:hypothetical protein [Sphingomonas sp.]|uniref:hypothetical protein n=1 Tax=Sphingomonas sp. TaxID=28214 RepID=UPI00286E8A73|nr:hypothetical protein [Sphingomonas sp.]
MGNAANGGRVVEARRFVDALGICTHPNWRDTAWGNSDWEAAFLHTGVKFTRGKIGSGPAARAALKDLRKLFARGVKICVTVPEVVAGRFDLPATKAALDFLANEVGAQNLCGIESANEFNDRGRPPDWAPQLRGFQHWLHRTVRANPAFDGIPLIGPSIWRRLPQDYLALGNLEPAVDRGCLHYYTGGRRPTWTAVPSRGMAGGRGIERSLRRSVADARVVAPTRPLWATEFGYAVRGPGADGQGNISEAAAAKYLVRGLFDLFGEGVEKIFIYALLDNARQSPRRYHGLLDGTLNARTSFDALHNLVTVFAESGSRPSAAPIALTVGNDAMAIKQWIFAQRDGTTLLAIYQDVDSYDLRAGRDVAVGAIPVELGLARTARRVEVYTPTFSPVAQSVHAAVRSVTVAVGDHVTVVKITP